MEKLSNLSTVRPPSPPVRDPGFESRMPAFKNCSLYQHICCLPAEAACSALVCGAGSPSWECVLIPSTPTHCSCTKMNLNTYLLNGQTLFKTQYSVLMGVRQNGHFDIMPTGVFIDRISGKPFSNQQPLSPV